LSKFIRQVSKLSFRIGEWSENPISGRPSFAARAAYSTGSPVACWHNGVCI
jgi:hypothetical protein